MACVKKTTIYGVVFLSIFVVYMFSQEEALLDECQTDSECTSSLRLPIFVFRTYMFSRHNFLIIVALHVLPVIFEGN